MNLALWKALSVTLISFWVFCIDQATKIYVHTQIKKGSPIEVIDGFFNISYVTNSGGAFGLFNGGPEWIRVLLFLLVPLACFVLLFVMLKETENVFQVWALSFILGGALGNYIDRLRLGYVVDFLHLYIKNWSWPVFNLADSFIVVGVAILSFFYLREHRELKKHQNNSSSNP